MRNLRRDRKRVNVLLQTMADRCICCCISLSNESASLLFTTPFILHHRCRSKFLAGPTARLLPFPFRRDTSSPSCHGQFPPIARPLLPVFFCHSFCPFSYVINSVEIFPPFLPSCSFFHLRWKISFITISPDWSFTPVHPINPPILRLVPSLYSDIR